MSRSTQPTKPYLESRYRGCLHRGHLEHPIPTKPELSVRDKNREIQLFHQYDGWTQMDITGDGVERRSTFGLMRGNVSVLIHHATKKTEAIVARIMQIILPVRWKTMVRTR